jgi:outer membrane receptor protein involved in Fe transport
MRIFIRSGMNCWIVGILFLALSVVAFAQQPGGGRPDMSGMPPEGIITGQVMEKQLNEPMEYTSVVLFSKRDSSIVTGTVTDVAGKFKLEKVPYGKFYVVANFIGYNKTTLSEIMVTPKAKTVDLGIIYLDPASTKLEGVEITADKARVEYKIDKKIVNVSQDLMASGSSAIAVLENVPSVNVDIEGNVSLRGSSSFTVLIDGRPSALTGNDALQQIPASSIDRIEIITNPSAKYDPDGTGGIINVIMKKQKNPGINGIANLSIGTKNKYRGDALLNYRTKNFNVFGGIDGNYNEFNMKGHSNYESYFYDPAGETDSTSFRDTEMKGYMTRKGYGIKAGIDYYMNDKSTLTFSGRYGGYGFDRDGTSSRHIYTDPTGFDEYSQSKTTTERGGDYIELNSNYIYKFDDKGHQLEAVAFYSRRNGEDTEEQKDFITDPDWNIIDDQPETIRTTEDEISDDIRIKADYTKPIGKDGKIEAGYQSRIELQNEKYLFQNYDYTLASWTENELYTSVADFKDNIQAVYSTFSNTWKTIGFMAGIRGEYTDRVIDNAQSPQVYTINRFDFFPSFHVSKEFKNDHQLTASYSRRVERPDGHQLDPFRSYMDPYNIEMGNPELEPEYIGSFELNYQKKIKSSFVSIEGYYRINTNKITRVRSAFLDTTYVNDSIVVTSKTLHTFQNMNKDYSLGAELMANLDLSKWFLMNASVNIFHYQLIGNVEGESVDKSSLNWNGKLNITLKFKYDFRAQISGIYQGRSVTAQGTSEGFPMLNLALRKDFFNKKLSTTLSVRDLLMTAKREMTSSGTGFYSYDYFKREAPILTLDLSYIINNYKKQRTGREEDSNQQMDMEF